jgi:sugar/nucleoside kinase (ribokinase family)
MLDESALAQGSLIVVGNINRDVKTSPISGGAAILSDGETAAESITETIGGGGANAAFAAAALGGRVAFLGKVGDDELGRRLQARLEKSRILARLVRDRDNPTGTSIALAYDSGHRHFISHLPSSRTLRFEDLDLESGCGAGVPPACGEAILASRVAGILPASEAKRTERGQDVRETRGRDALGTRGQDARVTSSDLSGFAHLLRADIWFSEAMLFGGNEKLFQWARGRNIPVSMDLNWDPLWGRGDEAEINRRKQAALDVLPLVTIAHGNVRELCACTRTDDVESALRHLEKCGVPAVLVHMGEKGAGYYSGGKLEVVPATPARRRLHATGTGDVLSVCAMLLHARQDVPVTERLELANRIVTEFIEGKRTLIPAL